MTLVRLYRACLGLRENSRFLRAERQTVSAAFNEPRATEGPDADSFGPKHERVIVHDGALRGSSEDLVIRRGAGEAAHGDDDPSAGAIDAATREGFRAGEFHEALVGQREEEELRGEAMDVHCPAHAEHGLGEAFGVGLGRFVGKERKEYGTEACDAGDGIIGKSLTPAGFMAFVEDQEHADGKEAAHEEIAEECVVIVGDRGRQVGLAEEGTCE